MIRKIKASVLVLIGGLALLILYLHIPGGKLWRSFRSHAARSLSETKVPEAGVISSEDIAGLPGPLRRYFTACEFIGKPMIYNACITFRNVPFMLAKDKDPMQISYQQYNSLLRPERVAFVNGSMFGIPFQGMDYYRNGEGFFTGVLAKHIPVVHSSETGEIINRTHLLTFLGDAVLMPSVFMADYVNCIEVDANTVKVGISCYNVTAEGMFYFNEIGEITKFICEDRLYDDGQGTAYPARWTIEITDYQPDEAIGVRRPYKAKVYWEMPEGDFVYFSSEDISIAYNVALPADKIVQP